MTRPLLPQTFTRRMLLAGSTALALALPAQTQAQTTAETAEATLAPITVNAADAATGPLGQTNNPAATAGAKSATPLNEIPQSVSVIGMDRMARQNITQASQALRYSAGVYAQPFGEDTDTDWQYIRGFDATQTGVWRDGLQNFSYAFGGFYTDAFLLDRVELMRGAASVLYGAANPGGLVNYVTKRPGVEKTELGFGINDAGTAWTTLDIGRRLEGSALGQDASWRLVARLEGGDKYDDWASGFRGVIAPSFGTTLDDGTQVTLLFDYTHIDEEHSGGSFLPYYGTVKSTSFGRISRDHDNFGEPGDDHYHRQQASATAIIEHPLDGGWTLSETARLAWSHVDEQSLYAYGYTGFATQPADAAGTLSRINFAHHTITQTALSDTRLAGEVQTGAVSHQLMFGLDARWFRLNQVQASTSGTPISASDPDFGAAQGTPVPYIDQVLTQTQVGLYAQDQLRWGNGWIATANLRHDEVQTKAGMNAATGVAGSDRADGATSWRLGLAREFANGLTPYATASSYFLPQIVTTADGNAVKPETGKNREVGLKWASTDGRTQLTADYFWLDRRDAVQSVWNGSGYDYTTTGRQRSKGVELEISHAFDNGLDLFASLTQMDVKARTSSATAEKGKTPYNVPQEMAALRADWNLGQSFDGLAGWHLGAGLRHYGKSYADTANTLKVPAVNLADLSVGYEAETWQANLAVSNIEDRRYVASCQTAYSCGYGPGREVSLTLTRRW